MRAGLAKIGSRSAPPDHACDGESRGRAAPGTTRYRLRPKSSARHETRSAWELDVGDGRYHDPNDEGEAQGTRSAATAGCWFRRREQSSAPRPDRPIAIELDDTEQRRVPQSGDTARCSFSRRTAAHSRVPLDALLSFASPERASAHIVDEAGTPATASRPRPAGLWTVTEAPPASATCHQRTAPRGRWRRHGMTPDKSQISWYRKPSALR